MWYTIHRLYGVFVALSALTMALAGCVWPLLAATTAYHGVIISTAMCECACAEFFFVRILLCVFATLLFFPYCGPFTVYEDVTVSFAFKRLFRIVRYAQCWTIERTEGNQQKQTESTEQSRTAMHWIFQSQDFATHHTFGHLKNVGNGKWKIEFICRVAIGTCNEVITTPLCNPIDCCTIWSSS